MSSRAAPILALDIATETGWCVGCPPRDPQWGFKRLPKTGEDYGALACVFHDWLYTLIKEHGVELVAFEKTMPSQSGRTPHATSTKLIGLAWQAEYTCRRAGVECCDVPAGTWKKAVCGTGRVSKSMKPYPPTEALAQRGWIVPNNNAADAVCIWLYAVGMRHGALAAAFDPLARRLAS